MTRLTTIGVAALTLIAGMAALAYAAPQEAYVVNYVPPNKITYEVFGSPYKGQTLVVDSVNSGCDVFMANPPDVAIDASGHGKDSVLVQCLCINGTLRVNIYDPTHTTVLHWTQFTFNGCSTSIPTLASTNNWTGPSPKPVPSMTTTGMLLMALSILLGGVWFLTLRRRKIAVPTSHVQ
jgi:hypothetical protein